MDGPLLPRPAPGPAPARRLGRRGGGPARPARHLLQPVGGAVGAAHARRHAQRARRRRSGPAALHGRRRDRLFLPLLWPQHAAHHWLRQRRQAGGGPREAQGRPLGCCHRCAAGAPRRAHVVGLAARPVGLAVVAASPAVALPAATSPPFCQRAPQPAP